MRSIHNLAYAVVLICSMFSIQPTLAAAEDARGVFTLTHEVHWQNYVLRAGDYSFALSDGARPTFLVLRGLNGTGTDAMLLINDIEAPQSQQSSKIVLVSRNGNSFVSSMDLPEYDMTLHFAVPTERPAK
jgi:hypothetical protein